MIFDFLDEHFFIIDTLSLEIYNKKYLERLTLDAYRVAFIIYTLWKN